MPRPDRCRIRVPDSRAEASESTLSVNLVHTWDVPSEQEIGRSPEVQLSDVLDLVAGLVAVGLITLVYADRSGLPRILLAAGFAFFVPGRAIVTNWPRMARWSGAAMSMVLSLAVLTLLATITLWAHVWHPMALFGVEAWLSLAGLIVGGARRHRRGPGGVAELAGPRSRKGTS